MANYSFLALFVAFAAGILFSRYQLECLQLMDSPSVSIEKLRDKTPSNMVKGSLVDDESINQTNTSVPHLKNKQYPIVRRVCKTTEIFHDYHISTGMMYSVPESNMSVSNLEFFATAGRPWVKFHVSSSKTTNLSLYRSQLIEGVIQRPILTSMDKIEHENAFHDIVMFPAVGPHSVFSERWHPWPEYTTAFLIGNQTCFWPIVAPELSRDKNISLLSNNMGQREIHREKVLVSGGFFENFWHAMFIFNRWCQVKDQRDVSFLVQLMSSSLPPSFIRGVASALGIDNSRIIMHDSPVIAKTVLTAPFVDVKADWSCLHSSLRKDGNQSTVVVYQRLGDDSSRNIPPEIHYELVDALSEMGALVKTFNGTESLEEARDLFSSAKIVVGPHGAGMANLIFVSSSWVPVVEYLTPDLIDRPWQLYGGGSFGLPWFPVLVNSFSNREEILRGILVVEKALSIADKSEFID